MTDHDDLSQRLRRLEDDLGEVRRGYVSAPLMDAKLETVRQEIALVAQTTERIADNQETDRREAFKRRMLVYGAVLTALASIVLQVIGQ